MTSTTSVELVANVVLAVNVALVAIGFLLAAPCTVLFMECLAALLPSPESRRGRSAQSRPRRVTVMVPAHDEQRSITETLVGIMAELPRGGRVLVVADNCSDDTALLARRAGAEVIERQDLARQGKGFALEFGIAHLEHDPPDVLVVLDADCTMTPGSLERLADFAWQSGRPAQADNLITSPPGASPLTCVSLLAFLVKNRVRPIGLMRLGLPCHLMGTGMAFPWELVRRAPPTGSRLAEDMQMGIELARMGFPPLYCTFAHVTSRPPVRRAAERGQRRRWEHGHIAALVENAPRLIAGGVFSRRPSLLMMGLDLLVPPLTFLVMMLAGGMVVGGSWMHFGGSPLPFTTFATELGLVLLGILLVWWKYGRYTLPARYLLMIPLYMAWKLPLYASLIVRGRQQSWDRAERSPSGSDILGSRPR
jgi:cellulose synthase/poly-beta-1,6-N-acetylglucosamine synthase-like glycosyltransferase